MNSKTIGIISVALVLALGAGAYAFYKNNDKSGTNNAATDKTMTPSGTSGQLASLTGEAFDRNFLASMIVHHQGAVDMAKLAQANAKRPELKMMADGIVSAQEKEIADMLSWQKAWGFPSTDPKNMQDHSAMGMMQSMAGMTAELEGKTGDEFDRAFIEQMIMHHQSAIEMATPGRTNAARQEVKDLAAAIVTDQTKEIAQLKAWQAEWGFKS